MKVQTQDWVKDIGKQASGKKQRAPSKKEDHFSHMLAGQLEGHRPARDLPKTKREAEKGELSAKDPDLDTKDKLDKDQPYAQAYMYGFSLEANHSEVSLDLGDFGQVEADLELDILPTAVQGKGLDLDLLEGMVEDLADGIDETTKELAGPRLTPLLEETAKGQEPGMDLAKETKDLTQGQEGQLEVSVKDGQGPILEALGEKARPEPKINEDYAQSSQQDQSLGDRNIDQARPAIKGKNLGLDNEKEDSSLQATYRQPTLVDQGLRMDSQVGLRTQLTGVNNIPEIAAMIKESYSSLRNGDSFELIVSLEPEILGKLEISLKRIGDRLSGEILVDNQFAREAMEAGLKGLKGQLLDQDIQLDQLNVSLKQDGGPGQQLDQGPSDSKPFGPNIRFSNVKQDLQGMSPSQLDFSYQGPRGGSLNLLV